MVSCPTPQSILSKTYTLAKYLDPILTHLTSNECIIQDSRLFAEERVTSGLLAK